jgi:hypothetical protein
MLVRAEVRVNMDCIGAIGGHRAADRLEATVPCQQPAGEYDPVPIVAANRRAQRLATCPQDDMAWDEV